MASGPAHRNGIIALVILTVIYASMGLFVRYLNTGFQIFTQVYLRVLAALIISSVVFSKHIDYTKMRKISAPEWYLLMFRAGMFYVLGVGLFSKAVLLTKYSNVAFIGAIPITAIYGFLLFKEKVTAAKIIFILLAFSGVVMITVRDFTDLFSWGPGEIMALVSAATYALSLISRKWHTGLLNNREITHFTLLIGFILLLATSLIFGEGLPLGQWTLGLLLAVITAGALNVANLLLTNYGFEHIDGVLASNILTLESVFALAIGFLFYQEVPVAKELVGGIIILISVLGMNQFESKK